MNLSRHVNHEAYVIACVTASHPNVLQQQFVPCKSAAWSALSHISSLSHIQLFLSITAVLHKMYHASMLAANSTMTTNGGSAACPISSYLVQPWLAKGMREFVTDEKLTLVQVQKGQSLLVMGPSGVGKTSVLRAIAGLWSSGSGAITRCAPVLCFCPMLHCIMSSTALMSLYTCSMSNSATAALGALLDSVHTQNNKAHSDNAIAIHLLAA